MDSSNFSSSPKACSADSSEPNSSQSQPSTEQTQEPTVQVSKAQLDLLANQLAVLATSVVEKQRFSLDDVKETFSSSSSLKHSAQSDTSRSSTSFNSLQNQDSQKLSGNLSRQKSLLRNSNVSRSAASPSSSSHCFQSFNDFPKQDIEDLMKTLPKYTGHVSESFTWWTTQIDSFLKTFNLRNNDIEYFIPKLLSGRAIDLYKSTQKTIYNESLKQAQLTSNDNNYNHVHHHTNSDTNESATDTDNQSTRYSRNRQSRFPKVRMRPLHWKVVKNELAKLDNPVARTTYLYSKIRNLRYDILSKLANSQNGSSYTNTVSNPFNSNTSSSSAPVQNQQTDVSLFVMDGPTIDSLIKKFRGLEAQLEYPAPLPDRLVLLFDVLPECKNLVVGKINQIYEETLSMPFQNIDEVCDFVLIYKDDILKQQHASNNNSSNVSNARKKRSQSQATASGNNSNYYNDKIGNNNAAVNTIPTPGTSSTDRTLENFDNLSTAKPNNDKLNDRISNRFRDRNPDRSISNPASPSPSPFLPATGNAPGRSKKERQSLPVKSNPMLSTTNTTTYPIKNSSSNGNQSSSTSIPNKSNVGFASESLLPPSVAAPLLNILNTVSDLSDKMKHGSNHHEISASSSSECETDDGAVSGEVGNNDANPTLATLGLAENATAVSTSGVAIAASVTGSAIPSSSSTVCNYCGRVGHKSTKCFKKKKDRQREKLRSVDSNGLGLAACDNDDNTNSNNDNCDDENDNGDIINENPSATVVTSDENITGSSSIIKEPSATSKPIDDQQS